MGFSATVPRFGMVVEVNLARCFLHRAYDALKADRVCEAGVFLREAIRRQLVAECNWHGCLPKGFSDRTTPMMLLTALEKAGRNGKHGFEWTKELIQTANRCCHAKPVAAGVVRDAISIMHNSIDRDPCGEPRERVEHCIPVEDCPDCDDDDDGAGWWKNGGVV